MGFVLFLQSAFDMDLHQEKALYKVLLLLLSPISSNVKQEAVITKFNVKLMAFKLVFPATPAEV